MLKPPECQNALLPDCFSPPALAGGLKRERITTEDDIENLYNNWDRGKYKYFIDCVAELLGCSKKDIPQVFYIWCVKHTRS